MTKMGSPARHCITVLDDIMLQYFTTVCTVWDYAVTCRFVSLCHVAVCHCALTLTLTLTLTLIGLQVAVVHLITLF